MKKEILMSYVTPLHFFVDTQYRCKQTGVHSLRVERDADNYFELHGWSVTHGQSSKTAGKQTHTDTQLHTRRHTLLRQSKEDKAKQSLTSRHNELQMTDRMPIHIHNVHISSWQYYI